MPLNENRHGVDILPRECFLKRIHNRTAEGFRIILRTFTDFVAHINLADGRVHPEQLHKALRKLTAADDGNIELFHFTSPGSNPSKIVHAPCVFISL